MHPLRFKARLDQVLPFLKVFRLCRKVKPDFRHSLRLAILNSMGIKMPKTDHFIDKNPYLLLGYGVNAYFDIMAQLGYMFCAITIMMLPLFMIFVSNHGLEHIPGLYPITQTTLGNMGGAYNFCGHKRVGDKQIGLFCTNGGGVLDIADAQIGVMSTQIEEKIYCKEDAIWESPINKGKTIERCSKYVNRDSML